MTRIINLAIVVTICSVVFMLIHQCSLPKEARNPRETLFINRLGFLFSSLNHYRIVHGRWPDKKDDLEIEVPAIKSLVNSRQIICYLPKREIDGLPIIVGYCEGETFFYSENGHKKISTSMDLVLTNYEPLK